MSDRTESSIMDKKDVVKLLLTGFYLPNQTFLDIAYSFFSEYIDVISTYQAP